MSSRPQHICIATLGGQPQVITLALDCLLARGYPIEEIIVVHLAPRSPRHQTALDQLASEFPPYPGTPYKCGYRPLVVRNLASSVDELATDSAVTAVCQTFHTLFNQVKQQHHIIHLCVSGGRRLLGILALSVAPFYFSYDDRVWHLYSSDTIQQHTRDGALMHLATPTDVHMLELALFPGGRLLPTRPLAQTNPSMVSPAEPLHDLDSQERQRCQRVWRALSPAQRRVLRAFAEGQSPQQVADHLHNSPKTVDTHKTSIYAECRVVWGLPDGKPDHYSWLHRVFQPYLADLV